MRLKDKIPDSESRDVNNKKLTTLFTGRHCVLLPETDSTNTYLSALLHKNALPEGYAVRTRFQKAGKGQRGSSWESENGKNLLQSFVFYPDFIALSRVFLLNKTFSLGVYDFVHQITGEGVSIKWPNDIYIDSQKVAGMLIENSISGSVLSQCILGIGVNVNQKEFSVDLKNATSFSTIMKKELDLYSLFTLLCSCVEKRYLMLKNGEMMKLEQDYLQALYGKDVKRKYKSGGNEFYGIIRGVDDNGRLQVEKEDGSCSGFEMKEIVFL